MREVDAVARLKEMVANVKKDPRAHSRQDLIDAAEAVFGPIDEDKKQVNKGPFIAWLAHEVGSLEITDVGGSGETGMPPFPEPVVVKPPRPTPAGAPGADLVTVIGKVDGTKICGRSYKIRSGEQITLPRDAAEFFKQHGFVE
jgi:hypothetical protein